MKPIKENKEIIEKIENSGFFVDVNRDRGFLVDKDKEFLADRETLDRETLIDPELILICRHCGKAIDQSTLVGLSLICPLCKKPQNGDPKNPMQDPYSDMTVICKHCGKPINQARLRGISLICPLCGMPQNGQPHPKT